MVQTEANKLVITVEHSLPEEFREDLKLALIFFLKIRPEKGIALSEEYQDFKDTLLYLLKGLIED